MKIGMDGKELTMPVGEQKYMDLGSRIREREIRSIGSGNNKSAGKDAWFWR